MATTIQFLRSDVPQQRPDPGVLANGTPMVNTNEDEPGLFFSARDGSLIKIGPTAVGDIAPNTFPQGYPGNCIGELWVDTSGANPNLKFFDGSSFVSAFTAPQAVTSVGLTFSDIFTVSGSPVTSVGTFAVSPVDQLANHVFAGPTSGSGGTPAFRTLVDSDIPAISAGKVTSGVFDSGRIPGLDASKIVSGTFSDSRIPNLNASKITNGVLPYQIGGTGITSTPQNGELLIGNGTGYTLATLTANANLSIANNAGSITLGIVSSPIFPSVQIADPQNDSITISAPAVTVPYTLKLPSSDGVNGSLLTTDGAGQLSFQTSLVGLSSIGGAGNLTINAGGANGNLTLAPTGSGTISASSARIINVASPTSNNDAANKAYVDTIAAGIQPKAQVEAASTADIDLATGGLLTIDTVPLSAGQRVLVKDQSLPEENGIYEAGIGAWTRSADADVFSELVGAITYVAAGAVNGGITFLCTSPAGGTIGVDPINWAPYTSAAGTVTSVGLSMPSIFSVSGSPVTTSGTLAASLATQTANTVFAGPNSGGAATPTFRALTNADISFSVSAQKYVNVLDYGADPTGASVSNTAFTNAMTAAQGTGKIVFCPPGLYKLNSLPLISGVTIEGATPQSPFAVGSALTCDNNQSIFDAGTGVQSVTIRNFWATAGGNNCKFFSQSDLDGDAVGTCAYCVFENLNTWLDFQIVFNGLFIFSRWKDCVHGYNGNQLGNGSHFIVSWAGSFNPTNTFNQTNINTVEDCYIFRTWGSAIGGVSAAVVPSYGWNFSFWRCDFESLNSAALYSVGCFGISFRQCWFENINATYVIGGQSNGGDNPQGVYPISLDACFINLNGTSSNAPNNNFIVFGGAAQGASVTNCNFVQISNGLTIANSPDLVYHQNCFTNATTAGAATTFFAGSTSRYIFDQNITPLTAGSASLGSSTLPWANVYTQDLNLSNEGTSNEVDGTWGSYAIQEGEDDLFLINRRSGKRYKFLLQEV